MNREPDVDLQILVKGCFEFKLRKKETNKIEVNLRTPGHFILIFPGSSPSPFTSFPFLRPLNEKCRVKIKHLVPISCPLFPDLFFCSFLGVLCNRVSSGANQTMSGSGNMSMTMVLLCFFLSFFLFSSSF